MKIELNKILDANNREGENVGEMQNPDERRGQKDRSNKISTLTAKRKEKTLT